MRFHSMGIPLPLNFLLFSFLQPPHCLSPPAVLSPLLPALAVRKLLPVLFPVRAEHLAVLQLISAVRASLFLC